MPKPEEKASSSSSLDFMGDYMNEPSVTETSNVPLSKPWQDNINLKFSDGKGTVKLSFPRIILLIQKNIKNKNTTKNWSSIKEQLLDATSVDAVKSVITQNALYFRANYVLGGTKKKRRGGRRKTNRRR